MAYVSVPPFLTLYLWPVQALDVLDPTGPTFLRCQSELRTVCSTWEMLPTSYMIPSTLLNASAKPVSSGNFAEIYEGTLKGSKICVKQARISSKDSSQTALEVHHTTSQFVRSRFLTDPTASLPGGNHVEVPESPKHCSLPRCHCHSLEAHFGLDAWRGPDRIHQTKPGYGSTWACRSFPSSLGWRSHPISCRMLLKVSTISTPVT